MAYRNIEDGDIVKIVDKGLYHGRQALVIDSDVGIYTSRVQLRENDKAICLNVLDKKLLIVDNPFAFIRDGRLDLEAKDKWFKEKGWDASRPVDPYVVQYGIDEEDDPEEACGECNCCKWHENNY